MKLKLIAILLVAMFTPAHADSGICASIGGLAENVMKGHQLGIPQRSMTALFATVDSAEVEKLGAAMMKDAYSVTRHSSESQRTKEAIMFSAKWEMICNRVVESSR